LAKSKVVTVEQAMEKIHEGMTLMVPGFVNCGVPQTLIAAILKKGVKDLNIISNNTSVKGKGIGKLVHAEAIKHITCSHIGNNTEPVEKVVAGEINVTFVPQGTRVSVCVPAAPVWAACSPPPAWAPPCRRASRAWSGTRRRVSTSSSRTGIL
jgi:acyl CoA:acetate/3-ketoacid CoA transferase alpha subunit